MADVLTSRTSVRGSVVPAALVVGAMVFALLFGLVYLAPGGTTRSLSATQSTSLKSTSSSTRAGINSGQPTSANSTSMELSWFGAPDPAQGSCGGEAAAFSGTGDGYGTTLYLPSGDAGVYPIGSNVCILTSLQNLDNLSASLPSTETVKVLNASSGATVYQGSCSVPSPHTGWFGPKSTWNCAVIWDTSKPYDGHLPTTRPAFGFSDGREVEVSPYDVSFTISLADSYQVQMGGGGIGFTNATTSSSAFLTALASSAPSRSSTDALKAGCVLTPVVALLTGPTHQRITTDGGEAVGNGTALVAHVDTSGAANCCTDLPGGSRPNSTAVFR